VAAVSDRDAQVAVLGMEGGGGGEAALPGGVVRVEVQAETDKQRLAVGRHPASLCVGPLLADPTVEPHVVLAVPGRHLDMTVAGVEGLQGGVADQPVRGGAFQHPDGDALRELLGGIAVRQPQDDLLGQSSRAGTGGLPAPVEIVAEDLVVGAKRPQDLAHGVPLAHVGVGVVGVIG
jgi:hypothetical protein